jgi:hypothetical protein
MKEIKELKTHYGDCIKSKDHDIRRFISATVARRKGNPTFQDDESTEVSEKKIEINLEDMHDFKALFGVEV